jgi:excisionase family DNA binding protein
MFLRRATAYAIPSRRGHCGPDQSRADRMTIPATFTVKEAAAILRVSIDNAYASVKDGTIPSVRIGHRIVVPRGGLERMIGREIDKMPDLPDKQPRRNRARRDSEAA